MITPYIPKFVEYVQENGKSFTSQQKELINEKEIKKYVKSYLKNNSYFSQRNVTIDFIRNILEYEGWSFNNPFKQLSKKIQSYISRAILPELLRKEILVRYNTRNYRIIKNLDVSLIEL